MFWKLLREKNLIVFSSKNDTMYILISSIESFYHVHEFQNIMYVIIYTIFIKQLKITIPSSISHLENIGALSSANFLKFHTFYNIIWRHHFW